jgi:predicted nuclease of predicted toxin-antitoxin system
VKFLIDNALSPALPERLKDAGRDAAHVRDYDMQAAADEQIDSRGQEEASNSFSSYKFRPCADLEGF